MSGFGTQFGSLEFGIEIIETLISSTVQSYLDLIVEEEQYPYPSFVPETFDISGSSFDFPLRFENDCDIPLVSSEHDISNNIKTCVMLLKDGVPLYLRLGSKVTYYVFDPNDVATYEFLTEEIIRSVAVGEKRAVVNTRPRLVSDSNDKLTIVLVYFNKLTDRQWFEIKLNVN